MHGETLYRKRTALNVQYTLWQNSNVDNHFISWKQITLELQWRFYQFSFLQFPEGLCNARIECICNQESLVLWNLLYINWKDIGWSKEIPEIRIILQTLSNCHWSLSKTGGHMQYQKTTWNLEIKTYFMHVI